MQKITQDRIEGFVQTLFPDIKSNWEYMHQHPELSCQEENTSKYIQACLQKLDVPYQTGYGGYGILAWLEGRNPEKRTIALRADMDALPVMEDAANAVCSRNAGVMHACGHDSHMAIVLGVAQVLVALKAQLEGRVLFIFQPAEETLPGGAIKMLEQGLFDQWRPDVMLAQHVFPGFPVGTLACKPGNLMASTDEVYITVKADGGHAAIPDTLTDTVLIASHIIVALQQIVSRNAPTWNNTVLSFGIVEAKGANNIIPPEVKLTGTLRTQDETWRVQAWEKIRKLATGVAEAMGATCEITIEKGYPSLHNDRELAQKVLSEAKELPQINEVVETHAVMTSEDFAYFAQEVPSCMYFLGCSNAENKQPAPLHSPYFKLDAEVLSVGVSTMTSLVLNRLTESENN